VLHLRILGISTKLHPKFKEIKGFVLKFAINLVGVGDQASYKI
jgi:hypothetical protein